MLLKTRCKRIKDPTTVARVFGGILSRESETDRQKEKFWVVGLDTHNKIKYVDLVSMGTLRCTLVHPREVFRLAVMVGVDKILAVHNHPSGDKYPSAEDCEITKKLQKAGSILGIELIDHVILGQKAYSMKENNQI